MHYNRKDIIQAWFLALLDCAKPGTVEYIRLITMQSIHDIAGLSTKPMSENCLAIYKQTCKNLLLNRSYF